MQCVGQWRSAAWSGLPRGQCVPGCRPGSRFVPPHSGLACGHHIFRGHRQTGAGSEEGNGQGEEGKEEAPKELDRPRPEGRRRGRRGGSFPEQHRIPETGRSEGWGGHPPSGEDASVVPQGCRPPSQHEGAVEPRSWPASFPKATGGPGAAWLAVLGTAFHVDQGPQPPALSSELRPLLQAPTPPGAAALHPSGSSRLL